jgi:predicted DNA-binding transcriptional regulator YafY
MASQAEGFGGARRRNAGEASESSARKIWLLLELLRHQSVRLSDYERLYDRDRRSFQRDLQQLRAIGKTGGFTISRLENGDVVQLATTAGPLQRLNGQRANVLRLVAEVARALGEPLRAELHALVDEAPAGDSFLHVVVPTLVAGSHAASVYHRLREAWDSPTGPASVRFKYRNAKNQTAERHVEPYRAIVRSGRYFLVGYDLVQRGWRIFALDAIVGMPTKAGTIGKTRTVPSAYDRSDAIGFIQGSSATTPVSVEFSAAIAASATSRVWNHAQEITTLPGGRARITIPVTDPQEVIRWAFGFGPDAAVVAPPTAVAAAHALAMEMAQAHGAPPA